MAKEKEKKSAWFYVMIIMAFFFVWLIVAQIISENSDNKTYYKETIGGDYSSSNVNTGSLSQTISLNSIGLQKTLNYPNQKIKLALNGQDNVISVTKDTLIVEINLNGLRNTINLCSTHSPSVEENGIDNKINYLNC